MINVPTEQKNPYQPLPEQDVRDFIEHITKMYEKEKSHLEYLERHEFSKHTDVLGMIARSKFMKEHLSTRLQEYKEYLDKHYGTNDQDRST